MHLAGKAFWPGRFPLPLLHIDKGPETIAFRHRLVEETGTRLEVSHVQDYSIHRGRVQEPGPNPSRNVLQTVTMLHALCEPTVDAAFGGGRRDQEKARAKERFFSHRDRFGQWDPKNQPPELWKLLNGKEHLGENFRIFPISNWTEMDVWQYIAQEKIAIPANLIRWREGLGRVRIDTKMKRAWTLTNEFETWGLLRREALSEDPWFGLRGLREAAPSDDALHICRRTLVLKADYPPLREVYW